MKNAAFASYFRGMVDGVFSARPSAANEAAGARAWGWECALRFGAGIPVPAARHGGAASMADLVQCGLVSISGHTSGRGYKLTARGWAATNTLPAATLRRCMVALLDEHGQTQARGTLRLIPAARLQAPWRAKAGAWSPGGALLHLAAAGLLYGAFSDNPEAWNVRLTAAGITAAESWPSEYDTARLPRMAREWQRGFEEGRALALRAGPKEHARDVPPRCRP